MNIWIFDLISLICLGCAFHIAGYLYEEDICSVATIVAGSMFFSGAICSVAVYITLQAFGI